MKLDNWQDDEPILLAFEEAWANDEAPEPHVFAKQMRTSVDLELLSELVMIDFEHRHHRNMSPSLEEYFAKSPQLQAVPSVVEDLVRHEFSLRRRSGQFPTEAEIDSRFGEQSTVKDIWQQVVEKDQAAASLVTQIPPGTLLGSYVVEKGIGIGAFATVYAATDTRLNRKVAMKLLLQSSDAHPESRLRMQREAKAIASVSHPCIVPIFETGTYRSHDYIVTRFVDGSTLAQHLIERSLAVSESVELVRQLASALQTAHQVGVVHRDIKPANVMLEDGVPQLLDFGLAALEGSSQLLTREGDLVGTPAYMPPEQADGHALRADGRSDIYSLGATLYRLVSGSLPFSGTTTEVISKVLHTEARFPPESVHAIDKDVQVIVLKCLQKDPADRYQTAGELEADLRRFLNGEPIHARPLSSMARFHRWIRRRPAVIAMGGIVLAAVCASLYLRGQLGQAVSRLDNAQQSNQFTERQLRDSALEAGLLALQRGQTSDAILYFEQSLKHGVEDRLGVLLKLVEANLMDSNLDACRKWWAEASALLNSGGFQMDENRDQYKSLVTLWQAELALAGCHDLGRGQDLMTSAYQMALPRTERLYVESLLADDSLTAISKLQQVLDEDTYHQRARLTLITTLISLGMLDQASVNLSIAGQLYPDLPAFILLQGLVNSLTSAPNQAIELLGRLSLEPDDQTAWETLYRFSHGAVSNPIFTETNSEFGAEQLASMVKAIAQKLPSQERFGPWRLPFVVVNQYRMVLEELPVLLNSDPEAAIQLLDTMTQVHPESSLLLALGSLRLAQCSGEPARADEEVPQLEEARQVYRLALNRPGLLQKDDQLAWRAVFTISIVLSSAMAHEADANMDQGLATTPHILESSIVRTSVARTFAILNLTHGRYEEADRWVDHWMKLADSNSATMQDAIWHKAVVCKRLENWVDVVRWCDELSNLNPEYPAVGALREFGKNQLRKVLDDGTDP